MSMTLVNDFIQQNLTGPQDKPMCLEYIDSLGLAPHDLDYAKSMLDRRISFGLFKKSLAGQAPALGLTATPSQTPSVQTATRSQKPDTMDDKLHKKMAEYILAHRDELPTEDLRVATLRTIQGLRLPK
jgi:hypothetical protein